MDSQAHPLDANSTPYNFSSTTSPLLHKAARALNLPARSPQSYVGSSSISSEAIPPLDERYTGQILVSSYHVSYILPKEFPRKESDSRSRRPSVMAQFMAAIDIWAPYISQPPHAPYLVSNRVYNIHVHVLIIDQAFSSGAPLSVKSHQTQNIPATYSQNVVVFGVPVVSGRGRQFMGSHLRPPCYPQLIQSSFSHTLLQQFCGRRVERCLDLCGLRRRLRYSRFFPKYRPNTHQMGPTSQSHSAPSNIRWSSPGRHQGSQGEYDVYRSRSQPQPG